MPDPRLPKKFKLFDPKDPNPCSGCSACCEYISIGLESPKTVNDFDEIHWFLLHKDVWVYMDHDGDWFVQFNTVCEKLDNRRCGIYSHRPTICRGYQPKDCERYADEPAEKFLFKNEMDLYRYLAKKRPKLFQKFKEKIDLPHSEEALLEEPTLV